MFGFALLAGGVVVLVVAALLLRGVGPGYRVARLLRAAMPTTPAAAAELARSAGGGRRYVRVRGRVRSEEEFPDENDRPLVFRRRRVEVQRGGRWEAVEDDRVAVPFGVEERGVGIDVDVDALGVGLVVLPREATGRAAELPGSPPSGVAADAPARLRIEQISAVELATVAGVPGLSPDGRPWLSAGLGRPLIVATLDDPEAMRVLASDHGGRVRLAAVLIGLGVGLLAAGVAASLLGLRLP